MSRSPHLSEFEREFTSLGAKPEHIRRLWRAWLGRAPWQAQGHASFPKAMDARVSEFRERLESLARFHLKQSEQAESGKLLVTLPDGACVEAVLLPRQALCISTQVGCAVGCVFCMTGHGGLQRQLSSAEIAAQYAAALRVRPGIKKVVMMGMGEPSHNIQAVREAVEFMGNTAELAHKQIVVSSVGDDRLFDVLPTWSVKPALALSLHTTDYGKRRRLLRNAPELTPEYLLERTLAYAEETKYPAQIEWTLLAGINDTFEEVQRLAELLEGRYAMVNFIAVNPTDAADFERPSRAHIEDLITVLRKKGIVATLRDSAAQDIEGGCGQLRARHLSGRNEAPVCWVNPETQSS